MSALVKAADLEISGRLARTSLALAPGELTCLAGPNGSGKTSLLHAMAGIGNPSGTVSIDGVEPRTLPLRQRMRALSYLPAARESHWPLIAKDLIALGCASREDERRIPALLDDLRLKPFATRRVDRLSTGERSRVLIARALVSQPKLLLLDEPAANLDPLWQLRLMEYLRAFAAQTRSTLLVAVHDLELARDFADRLILMNGGRIAADGNPQDILNSAHISNIFGIEKREGRWRPVLQAG